MNEVQSFKPIYFPQRGRRKTTAHTRPEQFETETHISKPATNRPIVNAIARALYWAKLIDLGVVNSGSEIALKEGLDVSTVNECLRLNLLAPSIIETILSGMQPNNLTIQWFRRNPLPANWVKQHALITSLETLD